MKLVFSNQYAELLLLVNGLAVLLYFAADKKKRKRAMKFGNYETLKKVAGENFLKTSRIVLVLKLLALTSLIIGISSPVLKEKVVAADSDYVIAVDSSASMLSNDISPTRLDAAKEISTEFISGSPNSTNIGLVSFSGKVEKVSDLTADKQKLLASVENISVGRKAGTAIGDALYASVSIVLDSNESKKVILITDGRNNIGGSVNQSVRFARKQNVTVNTIGLGKKNSSNSRDQASVIDAERANFQNINTTQLRYIANRTGGNFTTATNRSELQEALLKSETDTSERDISHYFVILALILMLVEWGLGTTKYDVLP